LSVRFVVAFSIFFLEFLGQAISGKDKKDCPENTEQSFLFI